ncbi:TPA: hypothetical protein KKL62_001865 [Escherichia coli]|nr:hypothetical protein [Escherichia coli]
MRVNLLITMIIFALIWPVTALRAAVSKTTWADAPAREFVFVENNSDDNFFVTPGGALDPRLTGANRWTGLKYTGSGTIYQQSLGYIDNGYNTGLYTNWKFDMWLENSPVSSPLTGLRCINWYAGCNMTTSLILPQTIGSRSGLSCKMVNYTLQTNGLSNTSIHIFPAIANSSLASAVGAYDMQFSLNGSSWKPVSNTAYYYTFNEMKSADSIYVFFSSNFFKQMVNLGISDINTKDLFNFRFQNTTSPESGWYEFSTSNTLIIKPRDFSISIISDEYTQTPSREGYVGSGESALDFGYIVTTSGKTAADEVLIKVTGPAQVIGGRSYCVFSSDDGKAKVPFPATLSFITRNGATKTYDAGCDDSWRDMTDALWLTTPWTDISGEVGQMDKTTVKFSIPMDNAISLRTVDDNGWFGEVSASGEIHVQATWRNIN